MKSYKCCFRAFGRQQPRFQGVTRGSKIKACRVSTRENVAWCMYIRNDARARVNGDLKWHAPLNFQGQQPGVQADRTLCLCKRLAHSPFWPAGGFNRSLSVKLGISPFPAGIGIQYCVYN